MNAEAWGLVDAGLPEASSSPPFPSRSAQHHLKGIPGKSSGGERKGLPPASRPLHTHQVPGVAACLFGSTLWI